MGIVGEHASRKEGRGKEKKRESGTKQPKYIR
jgi:hypothetical protein